MDWIEVPTITVEHPGHLGNRLIRFCVARAMQTRIPGCVIAGFDFPEWGFSYPSVDYGRFRKTRVINCVEQIDTAMLASEAAVEPSLHIIIRNYLQRQELFLDRSAYDSFFPIVATDAPVYGDRDLVISIRTGDILTGQFEHYTLLPINFYRTLCDRNDLRPVFVGQLAPSRYVDQLMRSFQDAVFQETVNPIYDFDTLRQATNVVPSISTFAVMAAWLGKARFVHLPLSGFLNPAHVPAINLLPTTDWRYRFYLFPLNYALPEEAALAHHIAMDGTWKEISHRQLAHIQANAPFLSPTQIRPDGYFPTDFDERWYVHEYIDAAASISEGWYARAIDHYVDIGRSKGYRSSAAVRAESANLAHGCRAWQSSLSGWSRGLSISEDAERAVNGDNTIDYAFHTDYEDRPWWMVDLGFNYFIDQIRVYNRKGEAVLQMRGVPLLIEGSDDRLAWSKIAQIEADMVFGAEDAGWTPLIVSMDRFPACRFVRLTLLKKECLHLAQIEVYGRPAPSMG